MSKKSSKIPNAKPEIDLATWLRLYDLAGRVRALEPWRWMEEIDLIGVRDPDNGDCFFISVMGALGEHHAIVVYPGAEGLEAFWAMQRMPRQKQHLLIDTLLGIHQVQVQFGKKSDLLPHEKPIAVAVGHKAVGALAWPAFRSMKPGWSQWSVDAREARLLELAMEQLLDVAPRLRDGDGLLPFPPGPDADILMRVRTTVGDAPPSWRDTRSPSPRVVADHTPVPLPELLMEAVRRLPPSEATFAVEVFPSLVRIGPSRDRPICPYVFMAIETSSRYMLQLGPMEMEDPRREVRAASVTTFLQLMMKQSHRPASVVARIPWLASALEGACRETGIKLVLDEESLELDEVRADVEDYLSQ